MNDLTAVRERVAAAVTAACSFDAHTHVPEVVTPPVAFVAPSDPYLTGDGVRFGEVRVNIDLVLIAGAGSNEAQADELDCMVLEALIALDDGFTTGDVSRPGQITLNGQSFLAVVIDCGALIRLPEEVTP